jgi:hypothetical protein
MRLPSPGDLWGMAVRLAPAAHVMAVAAAAVVAMAAAFALLFVKLWLSSRFVDWTAVPSELAIDVLLWASKILLAVVLVMGLGLALVLRPGERRELPAAPGRNGAP